MSDDDLVILVDGNDNPTGTAPKVRAHLPDGLLHRAFTALLFDGDGRLVLGRRAREKMLWPGCWDGTFASHPRGSETYVSSGQRRMPEELGISGTLEYLHKFEYHVPYRDVGSENEICATLIGTADSEGLSAVAGEIDEITAVSPQELLDGTGANPAEYCPWMLVALALLRESDTAVLQRHAKTLSGWMDGDIAERFRAAIGAHMQGDQWRLVR